MYRSSPFRSTLNTGYIKLWTCVALDQCKLWTPFGHFCPYFHTPYTLLCPKDEFTFTFRRGLIWKIDNPSTTLSLAPGIFDNPYKGAESAGCQKQRVTNLGCWRSSQLPTPLGGLLTWQAAGRSPRRAILAQVRWRNRDFYQYIPSALF